MREAALNRKVSPTLSLPRLSERMQLLPPPPLPLAPFPFQSTPRLSERMDGVDRMRGKGLEREKHEKKCPSVAMRSE